MDNLDFTEEEIQEQLAVLGYKNIPKHRLLEFKRDLDELIRCGEWRSLTPSQQIDAKSQVAAPQPSPPAYTKEKVGPMEGFFLHAGKDRQELLSGSNREDRWQQGACDSYAHHTVAPKLRLPPGAPNRLQVEPDPEETLNSPLSDSHASSADTQGRRFIKRKVLRKHKGQRHICDESVYSEDSALRRSHSQHTSAAVPNAAMSKMYNTEEDEDSSDDRNSLYSSSFWSDGEKQEAEEEEEEEEVEIERGVDVEPVQEAEHSTQETTEVKKPELNNQGDLSGESLEEGSSDSEEEEEDEEEEAEDEDEEVEDADQDDDELEGKEEEAGSEDEDEAMGEEEDEEDEENCGSSPDSPTPSLMTSGYGTYRPEEQEGADYRDDHTLTEFDQDSRGDLSEVRDLEDDNRSLRSFAEFDPEPTHEPDFSPTSGCAVEEELPAANVACCGTHVLQEVMQVCRERSEALSATTEAVTNTTPEEPEPEATEAIEQPLSDEDDEVKQEEEFLENVEKDVAARVDSEDADDSSSNKDIKFIDSKADFSWMPYDRMCLEWEGNLRHTKDAASCLEDRLAELNISPSAQQDLEKENEGEVDRSDSTRSSDTDAVSLGAFESYMRGLTRTQSDSDLRPKPKSFIRPTISQQTIKKTDPVAKYFQYKQLWDMFKCPGEVDRRALRWEIRERLAYQPPPPKPRRVYVPNTYIVPTEKKRSALRWEVRNDMANGLHPYKSSCRF